MPLKKNLLPKSVFSVTLFLGLQIFFAHAQVPRKVDSLITLLKNTREDTTRINILNSLTFRLLAIDPKRSLQFSEEMFATVERLEKNKNASAQMQSFIQRNKAGAYNCLGNANNDLGNNDLAIENFKHSLKIWEAMQNKDGIAGALHNLANTYHTMGNKPLALEYYFKALKINEETGNKRWLASNLNNIGNVYLDTKNYDVALEYYKKALIIKEVTGDKKGQCSSLLNIAGIYQAKKNTKEAVRFYKAGIKICEEIGNKTGLANAYNNLANVFSTTYPDSAFIFYDKALKISLDIGYKVVICGGYLNIANIYTAKKKYKESLDYLYKGLQTAIEMKSPEYIKEAYWIISDNYVTMNNYKMAYVYHKKFTDLKDSLMNEEATKQIAEMGTKYETEKKDKEILLLNKDNALNQKEIEKQSTLRNAFIAGFSLVLLFAIFILRGYKQKQKANEIIQLQKRLVEEKNKDITDSINYAKRIQEAILPAKELKYKLFPEAFVLFQPRDIVSGDFYWFAEKNEKKIIAAADCTGHGVPGAFMSMIGNAFLNEIINANGVTSPAEILDQLRTQVISALKQNNEENKDGMDISILSFDDKAMTVEYAGANNPMWLIRNGELTEFKADKQPIGFYTGRQNSFTNHKIELQKNDSVYIFTDGYADQFGGEKGKKFKYKKLQDLLVEIQKETMTEQENILRKKMTEWKGNLEQVDDILIIGVRV